MANKTYYTIAPIVKRDLCTGCGTCVGVCPSSAIKIVKDDLKGIFIPQIEEKSCNYCGICYDVCPGYHIN
ncbi:MAG: 4Fe-4S binding protein, partial [Nitrososphaerota archaeon]